jgi:hypothetical protein
MDRDPLQLQEYTIVCRNKHRTRYADGSQLGMHATDKHLTIMEQVGDSLYLMALSCLSRDGYPNSII